MCSDSTRVLVNKVTSCKYLKRSSITNALHSVHLLLHKPPLVPRTCPDAPGASGAARHVPGSLGLQEGTAERTRSRPGATAVQGTEPLTRALPSQHSALPACGNGGSLEGQRGAHGLGPEVAPSRPLLGADLDPSVGKAGQPRVAGRARSTEKGDG